MGKFCESVEVNDRLMIETFLTFFLFNDRKMSPHLYSNKSSLNLLPSFFKKKKKRKKKRKKKSPELKVKKINV